MAKESKPKPRSAAQKPSKRAPARKQSRHAPARKPKQKTRRVRRRLYNEFKPDSPRVSPLKALHFTPLQRLQLLRWISYAAVCCLCLVIQDSIMSRISILGATTDLAVAAMLLITVIEGSEVGSVFILIASCVYYFSGSAPGPYSVGMLTVFGLFATLFRQVVWNRSRTSILLCAGLAAFAYEIGLYIVGMFMGLTSWYRGLRFLTTAALTVLAMVPLYYIIYRIGQIGGHTWKE